MSNKSLQIVLFTIMINMMGVGLIWPILPSLVTELTGGSISSTAAIYGATAVVFSLMQFLFSPLMGALSDRFGRRPIMLIALLGLGFDNLLLAFANSIELMFAGRMLGGIFGATMVIANAYIVDTMKEEDRAAGFGKIGAAFGIGFIIGPLVGGVLGEIDLRLPFYCAAAVSFANAAIGYFFLQESHPPEKRAPGNISKANPFRTIKWLSRSKVLILLGVALMLVNAMQRGLESMWVIFTQYQYGWGIQEAGISLAIVGISYVVVQGFLVKPVINRFGEINTVVGGFLLAALMYAFLAVNQYGWLGYIGIVPYVLGWGCAAPALQAVASRQVGPQDQGLLQGALTSIGGLAAIAGPGLSTYSFAYFTSSAAPFHLPGAFFLLGAFVLLISGWIGVWAGKLDQKPTKEVI